MSHGANAVDSSRDHKGGEEVDEAALALLGLHVDPNTSQGETNGPQVSRVA